MAVLRAGYSLLAHMSAVSTFRESAFRTVWENRRYERSILEKIRASQRAPPSNGTLPCIAQQTTQAGVGLARCGPATMSLARPVLSPYCAAGLAPEVHQGSFGIAVRKDLTDGSVRECFMLLSPASCCHRRWQAVASHKQPFHRRRREGRDRVLTH